MMNDADTYLVERADQRRALSSPFRLEILGQFTSPEGCSISEIARRMGRPATALYYHIRMLEKVGILCRAGRRPAGKRQEALYRPVAPRIMMSADPDLEGATTAAVKTAASAFRMAERDMAAALKERTARDEGPDRNFFATRMHCCVSREALAEINEHVDAIYGIAARESRDNPAAQEYCSITLALLPLRGRTTPPTPSGSSE